MPSILRKDGYDIRVYIAGEHNPPHVHVIKTGADVRVMLNTLEAGPTLWDVSGQLSRRQVTRAVELVWQHHEQLLDVWRTVNAHL